ncbi:LCP family protein [Streptomyces sp. H27-D2]|uniref:LCP family protein n=1 Tax=Streptomyces sp. H27-D2 TaxID=3046304 RepID=UPI002DB6D9BC|nr:LCP family protein [Streptomyces sp. H27-D2]MEC4018752.1 LCP family protein [Streptomyces sp. H27-D2]
MDAQGRGQAGDIDPADQWVLDPDTGNYELRLDTAGGQAAPSRRKLRRASNDAEQASEATDAPRARRGAGSGTGRRAEGDGTSRRERSAESRDEGKAEGRGEGRAEGRAESRRGVPEQRSRRAVSASASASRRKPKPKKSGKKKVLYWTSGVMGFVLVSGCTGAYFLYQHFNGNINTVDIGGAGSGSATSDGPVNILVLGTDTRKGQGKGFGDAESVGHADTTILFHVSKDRSNATALSIPRDLVTDVPDCPTKQKDGSTKVVPGESDVRFNTSLGQGGRDPGCTMRTVKDLTGLKVDHFMMADFNAVKTLSSAVGGVDVCLAKDIDDPDSHLKLAKGRHNVQGDDALAFVRTRHSVGLGGDLSRIELQQQFLSSMMRKMKSNDTLTSPTKLFKLANAATDALTVDTGIGTIKRLSDLGKDLGQVNIKRITFATVPVIDNPTEKVKATVVLNEEPAEDLFAMLRADNSLTEAKKKQKAAQAARLKGPKADAADVRVKVLNGSGQFGAAQKTLDWMQNQEDMLRSSNGGNAPGELGKTSLEYAPNQADQARRLADLMGLPASAMKQGKKDAAPLAEMTLTLGKDFKGPGEPVSAPTKAPEGLQKVGAEKSVCAK